MAPLTSVNLHRFADSLLAEVVEETVDGEISIRSHEFEFVDDEQRVIRPRSDLSSSDAMLVDECVREDGYSIDHDDIEESVPRP